MDSNMDGIVDFDEFVAATMHVHQLEENNSAKWQRRSKAAFSKFDVDGDGYITAEELKIVSEHLSFTAIYITALWLSGAAPAGGAGKDNLIWDHDTMWPLLH